MVPISPLFPAAWLACENRNMAGATARSQTAISSLEEIRRRLSVRHVLKSGDAVLGHGAIQAPEVAVVKRPVTGPQAPSGPKGQMPDHKMTSIPAARSTM
jgi:hypothetical protein